MRTLRSSSVTSTKPFPAVSSILEGLDSTMTETLIPVCFIAYKYSYIVPNAIASGKLQLVNNKPEDVYNNGVWQNPYNERIVFAFAPCAQIVPQGSVTFKFYGDLFSNLNISNISFDPGDGVYRNLGNSVELFTFNYSSTGEKELVLRLVLTGGTTIYSHSRILITDGSTIHTKAGPTSYYQPTFHHTITNGNAKASVSVLVQTNSSQEIRKPFILVEGFDPHELCPNEDVLGYYDDKGYNHLDYFYWHSGYPSSRFWSDYDLIYIDWYNCEKSIETNAALLVDIINWINNNKVGNEKSVLWAQSMGGLIARKALVSMEQSGNNHQVSAFISHDVPYLGVNVPPGLLFMGNNLLHDYWLEGIPVSLYATFLKMGWAARKYLNGQSAQQMLINYIDKTMYPNHTMYNNMIHALSIEGFPQTTQNIAISNGGWSMTPANDPLIQINGTIKRNLKSFVESLLLHGEVLDGFYSVLNNQYGIKDYLLSVCVYPMFSNSVAYLLTLSGLKRFNWTDTLIPVTISYVHKNNPTSNFYLDNANGSYFELFSFGLDIPNFIMEMNLPPVFNYNGRFLFVPTASSLCVGNGLRPLTDTLLTTSTFDTNDTPFELIRIIGTPPDSCAYHTKSRTIDFDWVYNRLRKTILGPVCPTSVNKTYTLTNWNYPVSWSTDKSSVATINSSGVLTKVSDGSVNVKAQIVVDTDTLSYQKRVLTGLPAYGLHSFRLMGTNDYTVEANAPASILPIPAGATPIGQWGYKNEGSSTIVWQEPSNIFNYSFSLTTLGRHVYFKALNDVFTSPVSSIYCRVYPVYHDPFLDPLYVGGDGNFYTGGEDPEQIETRSAQNNISVTYNLMEGVSVSYDHIPSVSELLTDLLEFESFTEELHKMKCWGDEPFAIFPVNIYFCNGENTVQDEALLKFIYNSELK